MNIDIVYAILAVVLLALGAWAGWEFAGRRLSERQEQIQQEQTKLDEQWDTLQRTQRINEKFWEARQALRAEAQRAQRYGWGRRRQ